MNITVNIDGEQKVIARLNKIDEKMRPELKKALNRIGIVLTNHIRGKLSGGVLKVRTNRLRGSINYKIFDSIKELFVSAGTNIAYGRIHEYGGTIEGSPWLTIPLPAAQTASGVLRARARDWVDTFFRTSSNGNLILFQKRGKEAVPLFVLKHSVTIPKRPYMKPTLAEKRQTILSELQSALKRVIG